uniref:Granulins domain-containing protein n=1 Tax=Anabas testudineus TaxID=64144 RepID=A0AAQ6IKJ1_ANATE
MQWWVVICWALVTLVGADECPDGGTCERGQTCCNNPANGYECCPFDQAECCEDHMHCCPAGMICDVAQASCVNATECIPWVERVSAGKPRQTKSFRMIKTYMGEENDNICPDQSRCPPEFSCLRTLTRFGCCPLAQGVPCSDGKHCCPEGHQCSVDSRSCIKTELVTAVRCSDGVSECPDGTTCCETPEGKWGCCPMPKAVCCEDKIHCCPEGSTCDVEHSKCISLSTKKEMPMWAKLPARIRADWENKKGEQITSEAVDNGEPEKVPKVNTVNAVPPPVKEAPLTKAAGGNKVPCNDTAACEDGTTCCKTKDGGWACCPLPEAVCCKDFIHCCPKNTKCNLAAQTCDNDTSSVRWVEKVPAITKQGVQARDVQCDSATACPDGTTCCKTKEGGWACCPLPEAVCCEDFIHCCPKNTKCNLAAQTCDNKTMSVRWVEKVPAITKQGVQARNVTCDSTSSCPDDTTCCKNKTGGWACCPLPEAVCCDDHEHCCPTGNTCDLTTLTCQSTSGSTPVRLKKPAFTTLATTTAAPTTQTRETSTMSTEEEPKEPEEDEVMEAQEIDDDEEWENENEKENKNVQGRVLCDGHTSCPQYTTCCFMASARKWGCCPLPEAVCCADGNHCCPSHYRCDERKTSCLKGEVVIPWYTKLPATTSVEAHPSSEQCDDLNRCPKDTTCCKLSTGEWGCCPMKNGVCCQDHEHCCPQGYSCNMASKMCQQLQLKILPLTPVFLLEHQSPPSINYKDIPCDEKTSCKDGQTCCRMSATTWGCCPIPNAVCCSDMKHCCPAGYTCTDTGDCSKDIRLHWFDWHVFLANKKRALIV